VFLLPPDRGPFRAAAVNDQPKVIARPWEQCGNRQGSRLATKRFDKSQCFLGELVSVAERTLARD
jgi:hypothetical protein